MNNLLETAAKECDEWAEAVQNMIDCGAYKWAPFLKARARGQVFAYKNAASCIRLLRLREGDHP